MKKDHANAPLSNSPAAMPVADKTYGMKAKAKHKAKHLPHIESSSDDDDDDG